MPVPGREFMALFRDGKWDGLWTPGRWCRMRSDGSYEMLMSRGLILRALGGLGYAVSVDTLQAVGLTDEVTGAELLAFHDAYPQMETLRDYQLEAFLTALKCRWGRVALATNAGKGAVIALLAAWALQRKAPALIVCDELAVFDALQGEIRKWVGVDPGTVEQGVKLPPRGLITLAMLPTLARRLDKKKGDPGLWKPWLASHQMLLLDEADKATAPMWRALCQGARGSHWRVGFSGTFPTADTFDDWQLESLMGPVLVERRNLALVQHGISAKPTVTLASYDATDALQPLPPIDVWREMRGADLRQWTYEHAVVYNAERHALIRSLIRPDVPTAVIVNRIAHGEQLQDAIPGSVFLDGSISAGQRRAALEGFQAGDFSVLIVTKILDRGTNRLGSARDIIFASSEGSLRQTLQRIGRGLRRTDGKAELRLVDIIDRVVATDKQTRLRRVASYLHAAGRQRTELYGLEGFEVEVVT